MSDPAGTVAGFTNVGHTTTMLTLEESEVAFARSAAFVLTERDVVEVVGPDAAGYLQGQLSQNVESMAVGDVAYTLLLQPQGKVDAWLRLHRVGDEHFWMDVEPGFGPRVTERLERFKLRMKADITARTMPVLSVRGPGAAAVADLPLPPDARVLTVPWLVLDAPDGQSSGADVFVADAASAAGIVAKSIPEAPAGALELWRISHGRPAMGTELDESTIPAAAGVVAVSVDFTKGCYVGQELVARIDSRGNNTPTRLVKVTIDGPQAPAAGSPLTMDDLEVGTVTSAAVSPSTGAVALAYVKRGAQVPGPVTVHVGDSALHGELTPISSPGG